MYILQCYKRLYNSPLTLKKSKCKLILLGSTWNLLGDCMARIKINSGNRVISIESDDAGVPDVTEGTGPDIIELQDDAMAEPGEENSEFDASIDDSEVEEEDKMEAVEKANESFFDGIFGLGKKSVKSNESFFDGIFGLEDGEVAAITDDGDGATSDTDEVVTSEETDGDSDDGEGAGEVSEGDGTTTVDTGDVVITITNSDEEESDDDDGVSESDDDVEENNDGDDEPVVGEENADPDEMDNDQAIESFFQNLGL